MENMVMDKNPCFGKDKIKERDAKKVSEMLWETSQGDLSKVPQSYLENLGFSYSDGDISLLDQLSKVDLKEGSHEEFSEVVGHLVKVNPEDWPSADSILSIQSDKLLYEIEDNFSFSELDFSSRGGMSDKVELFLKKVISSVYLDGVSSVTDREGNPPNAQNNYLLSPDGRGFSGIFYDSQAAAGTKKFPFEIKENSSGNFQIEY